MVLLHLLLVSGYSSLAKPQCQNLSQRAWSQNLVKLVLVHHSKIKVNFRKLIYFQNCWPMQCLCPRLLVNIYPRPTQGTRKHATVSAKSRSTFSPHIEEYLRLKLSKNCDVEKWKYAQSSSALDFRRHTLPKKFANCSRPSAFKDKKWNLPNNGIKGSLTSKV